MVTLEKPNVISGERFGRHVRLSRSRRIEAVDAVRGLAIVMMVFSHGLHWFYFGSSHDVVSVGALSIGDLAAPLFFIVAGMSLQFSLRSRLRRPHASVTSVWRVHRRRFTQLFLIGVPLALAWGVLQAQAVALAIVAYVALYVDARMLATMDRSTAVHRASPAAHRDFAFRAYAHWPFALALGAASVHALASTTWIGNDHLSIVGDLLYGQFPVAAVVALVAFGFGCGRVVCPQRLGRQAAIGALLLGGVASLAAFGDAAIVRLGMPPAYLLLGAAFTLTALAALNARPMRSSFLVRLLALVGRRALFLFLLHYGLIVAAALGLGWWDALSRGQALLTSGLLVVVTVLIGLYLPIDARAIYRAMDHLAERHSPISSGPYVDPTHVYRVATGPGLVLHPKDGLYELNARLHIT